MSICLLAPLLGYRENTKVRPLQCRIFCAGRPNNPYSLHKFHLCPSVTYFVSASRHNTHTSYFFQEESFRELIFFSFTLWFQVQKSLSPCLFCLGQASRPVCICSHTLGKPRLAHFYDTGISHTDCLSQLNTLLFN